MSREHSTVAVLTALLLIAGCVATNPGTAPVAPTVAEAERCERLARLRYYGYLRTDVASANEAAIEEAFQRFRQQEVMQSLADAGGGRERVWATLREKPIARDLVESCNRSLARANGGPVAAGGATSIPPRGPKALVRVSELPPALADPLPANGTAEPPPVRSESLTPRPEIEPTPPAALPPVVAPPVAGPPAAVVPPRLPPAKPAAPMQPPTEKPPVAPVALPVPPPIPPPIPPAPAKRSLTVGTQAYAIESLKCEGPAGVWATLYHGEVLETAVDSAAIRVDKRFAVRFWPEEEGVDTSDWFCAPRRRFCIGEVGFRDWQGTIAPADIYRQSADRVFPAKPGLAQGLNRIIQAACR